jgi:hypothetical protein
VADEPTATVTETPSESADGASVAEDGSQSTSEGTPEGERDDTGRYLSREAASYRRRLREAEAERDQLRAQLDALQSAEVERLAQAAGLSAPSDVWLPARPGRAPWAQAEPMPVELAQTGNVAVLGLKGADQCTLHGLDGAPMWRDDTEPYDWFPFTWGVS